MNFYVVITNNIKKFDKYKKNNKIKRKTIIDIKQIVESNKINPNNKNEVMYFKLLVYKEITTALEKNNNIYYIPYIDNPNRKFNIEKILKLKKICRTDYNYNLIYFFDKDYSELENHVYRNVSYFDDILMLDDY